MSSIALRSAVSLMAAHWSPPSDRRLNIVMFHRVRPAQDPLFPEEPDSQRFDQLMAVVAANFNCLSLNQAVEMLARGLRLPPRALAITFDDGYADNFTEALPILKRHALTATFFVASGFLNGGLMWNDEVIELVRSFPESAIDLRALELGVLPCSTLPERRKVVDKLLGSIKYRQPQARREALNLLTEVTGGSAPGNLMMTSDQVREMQLHGMTVGGHTLGHPILSSLDNQQARREIGEDRERLAAILGEQPQLFAYPNGKPGKDYHSEHPAMVRDAGYRAACSTTWGAAHCGDDLWQLPRFTPWDRNVAHFALRLAHNYSRSVFSIA